MSDYNILNNKSIDFSSDNSCVYDSNLAYDADFSVNGEVGGWDYYDGIHTYGCWNNFLFGTLYGDSSLIGRTTNLIPFPADKYIQLRLVMKLHLTIRNSDVALPSMGKIRWTTTVDSVWNDNKSKEFNIYSDDAWHEYIIDMSDAYYWQGNIQNLRIHPIFSGGRDGDEFFIKAIQIKSINYFECRNKACSYYISGNYDHPCGGIGSRGRVIGAVLSNTFFNFDENDCLFLNINGYGFEKIKLESGNSFLGTEVARLITTNLGKINIGGYAEGMAVYEDSKRFVLYSGTYNNESTIEIGFNNTAIKLGFYDSDGNVLYSSIVGTNPANGFLPNSSMKITSYQLNSMFDNSDYSYIEFNPFLYNVEGGRSDWLYTSMGQTTADMHASADEKDFSVLGSVKRVYSMIDVFDKTIIDFNHPFNASGRINKISLLCSLDKGYSGSMLNDTNRIAATGSKIKIFRPRKDGAVKCVAEIPIPDRGNMTSSLYSINDDGQEIDCDLFVNKGDLIGVYNVKLYTGKTKVDNTIDATYYMLDRECLVGEEFYPGELHGNGSAGLLIYARSNQTQKKLVIDIDLKNRMNIDKLIINGEESIPILEYNIARCLDINWRFTTFNLTHKTSYFNVLNATTYTFEIPNTGYGLNTLSDGIYIARGGKSADSFSSSDSTGVIPVNPYYFWVNGDHEWMGIHYFNSTYKYNRRVYEYKDDPIAFYIIFPHNKSKVIYKSIIYFKEKYNFRNIALSYYLGEEFLTGNADDKHYHLIPKYTAIILDGVRTEYGSDQYESMKDYLFDNPAIGYEINERISFNRLRTVNMESVSQAIEIDWQTIAHEWEPIEAKGFRIYCDRHESTKICEIELMGYVPDSGNSLSGGLSIIHSLYGDYWYNGSIYQRSTDIVDCFIQNTPRYLSVEISPITTIKIRDILFTAKESDIFLGKKGCESSILLTDTYIDRNNESKLVNIKNTYGKDYDLYVDISDSSSDNKGIVFYSKMDNKESIDNPEIGPGGLYKKNEDYKLLMNNNNVAINCNCYGLEDLSSGKKAWYTNDSGYSWNEWGTISKGVSIDFSNLPTKVYSVLEFPEVSRSKFWKLRFKCKDHNSIKVSEMRVYYHDVELTDIKFYYGRNTTIESPLTKDATHLDNKSVTGSYYIVDNNSFIGFSFPTQQPITKIVFFHEDLLDYSISLYQYGIDLYTMFCLKAGIGNYVRDYSYNEIPIANHSVITKNTEYVARELLDYEQDFFSCEEQDWSIWEPYAGSYPYFFDWACISGTCISGAITSGTCDYGIEDEGYMALNWVGTDIQPYYGGYHGAAYKSIDTVYESWRFRAEFKIKFTQLDGAISFGFLKDHRWGNVNWDRQPYWGGCQISISGIRSVAIVVHDNLSRRDYISYDRTISSNYIIQVGTMYYFRLESNGKGNYSAEVWEENWDTGTLVWSGTLFSTRRWNANKFGVGGCNDFDDSSCNVYFAKFYDAYTFLKPAARGDYGCEFSSADDSYLEVNYDQQLSLYNNRFNFDFHVNFYSLPNDGESAVIAKMWPDDEYSSNAFKNVGRSWALVLKNNSGVYYLQFHACCGSSYSKIMDYNWTPQTNRWYHINFSRGAINADYWYRTNAVIDKYIYFYCNDANFSINDVNTTMFIGKDLDGLISNFRLSKSVNSVTIGGRIYRNSLMDDPPFKEDDWERMYTVQLYASEDNTYYGHYMDVELSRGNDINLSHVNAYDNFDHYYSSNNAYSSGFYSYFAIDLEQRHNLQLIRSFGDSTNKHNFSINTNVEYSNMEVTNPALLSFNSDNTDCRWVIIKLYNGDGSTYTIRKLGIYPDITTNLSQSLNKYNCYWTDLGKSITSFSYDNNLSINATISGSPCFNTMSYTNVIDGITDFDFFKSWGSDGDSNPWFILDLGAEFQIYRFKVFHGIEEGNTAYLVTGYNIQYSTDATNYSTAFTITGNSSFERTHDLATPIVARWIKFYVTSFNSRSIYLRYDDNKYKFFDGAVLREFEVYEYYGYDLISSEEYPIIALNLGSQHYLQSEHTIIGIDAESTTYDWSSAPDNFCYSDSIFSNPQKIVFGSWGAAPYYEQWAVLKRDTATNYNSGPDYIKHLLIKSIDKKNPCEYPQWWDSSFSTLAYDYSLVGDNSVRSLKITYPAITQGDTIHLIEGDDFGIDTLASWRDGLGFNFAINTTESLDLDQSYFFLGGYDPTPSENEVLYKWYFSTLSGSLYSSMTDIFLRFKSADTVEYTPLEDYTQDDPRIISNLKLKKLGLTIKGKGTNITEMLIDGFEIRRNHFFDGLYESNGLYLTGNDLFTAPLSEFRLSSGAISFWCRLDYDFSGNDFYGNFKDRLLFHFNNVHNDVFGCQISNMGLEFYAGNINENLDVFSVEGDSVPIDTLFHMAIVFSNDGSNISSDNSTIRVYINGNLYTKIYDKWVYKDDKSFCFVIGGKGIMATKTSTNYGSVDAVIGGLKLYNYCKTDFNLDFLSKGEAIDSVYKSSDLIEISKDNINFFKAGSEELPFRFELVPNGTSIPIYIKPTLPSNLTGSESRTSGLLIQWDIGV